MHTVISPEPSLARLARRKNPPTFDAGSYTLKYIDSLKFGSGPSSWRYSSCGSSRTPMRATLGERHGTSQVLGELVLRDAGVQPARRRHDVHGPAPDGRVLDTGGGAPVDGGPPPREADEHDGTRLQPVHEARHARVAGAVLVGRELVRAHGRPLDEIGEADVIGAQRVPRVAVARDDPGVECRGPEAIARTGEPDARVRGVQARVEPADEQPHVRVDDVRQRARTRKRQVDAVAGRVRALHVVGVEARAGDDVEEAVTVPQ